MDEGQKISFLKEFVKSEKAIDELIRYTKNKFSLQKPRAPFFGADFKETWKEYFQESQRIGSFNTLKKYLVQLQFPLQEGISRTEEYRNVTLKGKKKESSETLILNKPDQMTLQLHKDGLIGGVPILIIPDVEDFSSVICALSNKNEPQIIPSSMGALCINGLNNWNRINTLKEKWRDTNPFGNWSHEFRENIIPNPHLYKDTIIVLSEKDYSDVKGEFLEISEDNWKDYSLVIRREHECAHLFTLHYYGSMANNLHDEIVADYAGITAVTGVFKKQWFLNFMGLENAACYREGGRLQNYNDPIKLSVDAFNGLKKLVRSISESIEKFDAFLGEPLNLVDRENRIRSICEVDMLTMASKDGANKLMEKYKEKSHSTTELV